MANINPDDTKEPIESAQSSEVPQGNQDGLGNAHKTSDSSSAAPAMPLTFSDQATLMFWLPPKDKARHITTVWDGKEFVLYVDGEFQDYKSIQYAYEDDEDEPSIEPQTVSDTERASLPSSGSQDSIDREAIQTLVVTAIADGIDAYEETGTFPPILGNRATDEILELVTAWHNTQLKAAIPEKKYPNAKEIHYSHPIIPETYDSGWKHDAEAMRNYGYNQAIDDMQANLEQ